jgi:hypothetical protein
LFNASFPGDACGFDGGKPGRLFWVISLEEARESNVAEHVVMYWSESNNVEVQLFADAVVEFRGEACV